MKKFFCKKKNEIVNKKYYQEKNIKFLFNFFEDLLTTMLLQFFIFQRYFFSFQVMIDRCISYESFEGFEMETIKIYRVIAQVKEWKLWQ